MKGDASIRYIIRFLIGDNLPEEVYEAVGYTADTHLFNQYRVVIRPSSFFDSNIYGQPSSLPSLPLKEVEDIPLLFGQAGEERIGDTFVLDADIIASTYFLVSRYEEWVNDKERDEHGRFPGKSSLPYKAGCINRAIVDEYGYYLREKLRSTGISLPENKAAIKKIYLTHDVDEPFFCRSWRNVLRETLKGGKPLKALQYKFGALANDLYYTFPWLFNENDKLKSVLGDTHCEVITFFKSGGNTIQDKPTYNLLSKDLKSLFALCESHRVQIGLHSSYQAGLTPSLVAHEKECLERATGKTVVFNRHHFLSSREPKDMLALCEAGITHDFSIGYADVAGFRLGTSKPVKWINPENKEVTPLTLHPLTIMECSLSDPKYMGLSYDEAIAYTNGLIMQVRKHNGELVLLWHNSSIADKADYQKQLYTDLINELKKT